MRRYLDVTRQPKANTEGGGGGGQGMRVDSGREGLLEGAGE